MKNLIFLVILLWVTLCSYGQGWGGFITNHWPLMPNVGDTINIEYVTYFPINAPNGKSCGMFTGNIDTVINSKAKLTTFFDICYVTGSPTGCLRDDTIQFIYSSSNIDSIMLIWNLRGTLCLPISQRYIDTSFITFNITSNKKIKREKLFSHYPNPVNDYIHLEYPQNVIVLETQLWNTSGQQLPDPPTEGNKINLKGYESGIYFLRIESNQGAEVLKVVKQ